MQVQLVVPHCGRVGEPVALLGDEFIKSNRLTVRVDDTLVQPTFHEKTTLLFDMPAHAPGEDAWLALATRACGRSPECYRCGHCVRVMYV